MGDANNVAGGAPLTVEYMSSLLSALTQPDTNTIRQAEQQLKPIIKEQPASMMILWQICSNNNHTTQGQFNDAIRHVGAIVLRKRLPTHYGSYDKVIQQQWQQQVLQAMAVEPVRTVRSGLVGVAAVLAQQEGIATQPFLQFLAAAVNDANPMSRELCFLLLSEMTDTVGMHWKEHLQSLYQLYLTVLQNPNEQAIVQKAAVQSLGQLMSFWADDPEMDVMAPLLPLLLQVAAKHHVTASEAGDHTADEEFLTTVMDILYDLSISHSPSLLPHMAVTVEFALQCLQNTSLELRIRDSAALVIATTAEYKPKSLGRHTELLGRILDILFALMENSTESAAGALFESNPAWRQDLEDDINQGHSTTIGGDDDDDMDSPTETSMAQGTLDVLACEIPKKFIWNPLLQRCMTKMQQQDNANSRKAGVAGLGVIAEGCCDPLTSTLSQIMPYVLAAAQDPAPQVRECACFCLGQMSEHCQPDILQYSAQILPTVFNLLDDGSVAVQATSCYVLETFCERLEPEAVRPLLDSLVRKLATMLERTNKRSVQEMAVAALAATAVAAEEEFSPYIQGVANLMGNLMSLQDTHLYSLRGRALECMGHMAIAVGRDTFRPYFPTTMKCAMENLTTDSTDLQEFTYAVFANLAKVMKEEFAPALPELVPHLVKVIEMDEGQLEEASGDEGGFAGLDDSDDEDGENGNYIIHVRTALLEVKKGAITALGEMAAHTGTSFCPHLESCMQVLQKAAGNWHPLIKGEVADAMPSLIVPSIAAYHNGEIEWKKGDVAGSTQLSAHTVAIVQAVLTEEMTLMKDDDKATVGKACEAVQSVIELCGPQALNIVANDCMQLTHDLLTRKAPCQLAEEEYGELPDDDDDHDVFMQAACGLVGAFGRVMGQHFAQYLPQFLPAVCEYGKSSRPPSDRSMAVGCLSDIAQELEGAILEHWQPVFLPAVLAGLADADENVKRNSAFCAGICCEHLREHAAGEYQNLLQHLGPIFALDPAAGGGESTSACIDNAAAAVSRMIMACPNQVPMSQVLPVMLRSLPLKTDMTENETVYTCLLGLLQMKHPDIMSALPEVKRIFTEAVQDSSKVDDEIKNKLRQALQEMG